MNLGERIKKLREMRNLTLEDVGNYVGVNKATVQRYESGNIDIKRNVAIKLAEILQSTPSYIMGWSDEIGFDFVQENPCSLSQIEAQIINNYRSLNTEGQERAINYLDDLISSGKYIKNNLHGTVGGEKHA